MAFTRSAAYWKASKPVTTSKLSFSQGSSPNSPTRISASGARRVQNVLAEALR
jgi:hypothetical protein